MEVLNFIINKIASFYNTGNTINGIIATILAILVFHKPIYFLIGLFFTRKFKPAKNKHKYAIMIAARNEEKVIGNLIDSIHKQDYPKDLLTIFVVADNCTDSTAKIVRDKGCICYERFDNKHKTKGYALEFLVDNIKKDYGIESFEGYFIFDADNLLKKDFISKMNNAFDSGEKIITSYRNTKNFDENWVASTYAIHWIRSIRLNHRARSVLRLATNIQGTGFLFSNEVIKDGWHYTSLTEDRALTADAVAQGYQITYQDEAEFYDEQPTSLKIAWRQRLRWSKGHLQAFAQTGPYLFANIFLGKHFIKTKWRKIEKKKNKTLKDYLLSFIESIRHRFASFDTLSQLTPISFINLVRWLVFTVIIYCSYIYVNGLETTYIFDGSNYLSKLLGNIFNFNLSAGPGFHAMYLALILCVFYRIIYRLSINISNMLIGIYVLFIERKRIKKISLKNKILFILTWPTFDIIGRYTTYAALFKKVTWKPIPHNSKVTIDNVK